MGFGVIVFDESAAPPLKTRELVGWTHATLKKKVGGLPARLIDAGPKLQLWLDAMYKTFPNFCGPDAPADLDDESSYGTDYTIRKEVVYALFASSLEQEAQATSTRYARDFGLSLIMNGKLIRPTGEMIELIDSF